MSIVNLAVSSFSTTGTIAGGALSTLTVANASGFAIGDRLIVEVGGEAGGGLRGTIGVGGLWPTLAYANTTAMNADLSKPNGQYCYITGGSDVYQFRNDTNVWVNMNLQDAGVGWYVKKIIPRALAAQITGKSGNTLTISPAATVATTNANVYFDNAAIITATTDYASGVPNNSEIILPTGEFAISATLPLYDHHNWVFHGTSKDLSTIFYPEGAGGGPVFGGNANLNLTFRDFGIRGHCRENGYMVLFLPGVETYAYYNEGLRFSNCVNMLIQDFKAVDCNKSFSFEGGCTGSTARRVEAILTEGVWIEQWQFSGNDSEYITFEDCTMTAATWTPGPEFFRCHHSRMIGITLVNAFLPLNTVNDWLLQDITITLNGADQDPAHSIFGPQSQAVDINRNIDGIDVSMGGVVKNLTVTQNGVTPSNDTVRGLTVAPENVNVRVYNATFNLPNYVSGSTVSGAVGLSSDAPDTEIVLITCHGTTNPQWPAGGPSSYANVNLSGGTYRCVTTDTGVKGGTQLPCQSFAVHCV